MRWLIPVRISEIWVYPIKACGGDSRNVAEVTRRGLADDRRYMLVDEAGRFVSQRQRPALSRTRVSVNAYGHFQVEADDMDVPLCLPRSFSSDKQTDITDVTVWGSRVHGVALHTEGSDWFSRFIGESTRLVFMGSAERPVAADYRRPGDIVSFADGFPLLLTNRASLDDLNRRVAATIPMTRFRPNVVIEGAPAYAEDTWTSIRLGPVPLRGPKLCSRCVVTTIGLEGTPGKEPLRTLAKYRRRNGHVFFGLNLIPDAEGPIEVGSPVAVEGLDESRRFLDP